MIPCLSATAMHMGHPPMHQEETLLRRWLLDTVPILRTEDVATTMLCAAMARVAFIVFVIIAVIIREFLACPNILDRHKPDGVAELFRVAVGLARMVDKSCCVLARMPINGIPLIQAEDIDIACG